MTRGEEIIIQSYDYGKYLLDTGFSTEEAALKCMRVAFIDGARWADEHPHWISVKDELPPKDKAYLAYWQHLGVTKYRYVKAGAKVSRTFSEHITHWMPLPSVEHLKEK